MGRTNELYERARKVIPGGTQLLSKRPELFLPGEWPAYFRRAKGVEVEDLDGRVFVDVSIHAVGSCPLGYADPDVERAVVDVIRAGNMASPSGPEEVELAELLCELHPWAEMVRYTRGGGESMALAARVARAASGRDLIAFSGYHGWHDWYIAANLVDGHALDAHLLPDIDPSGVPESLRGSIVPFLDCDRETFDAVVARHGERLAAIVLEPARYGEPPAGWLQHVRETADRLGAVLVFDEITSGFRRTVGGAHLELGVEPDVAVYAKAMSNGYPMGAVIGRRGVLEAAERSFVSSTYWSERIGPTAALATIGKLREHDVPARLCATGERMRAGWRQLASEHGLEIATKGIAPLPTFSLDAGDESRAAMTLYTQCMFDEGFLAAGGFYASYAHTDEVVDRALAASSRAFARVREALDSGSARQALRGEIAHSGPSRRAQ